MSVNIEDKIVLLKETVSDLNTQYGNKLDYRGPSHYIFLHNFYLSFIIMTILSGFN